MEAYGVGAVLRFVLFLWDGDEALTGKTVALSIRRESDSFFWDHDNTTFTNTAYTTSSMTEQHTDEGTSTNVHIEGQYVYDMTLAETGTDQYTWSVKYSESPYLTYFKGAFETVFGLTTSRRLVAVGC